MVFFSFRFGISVFVVRWGFSVPVEHTPFFPRGRVFSLQQYFFPSLRFVSTRCSIFSLPKALLYAPFPSLFGDGKIPFPFPRVTTSFPWVSRVIVEHCLLGGAQFAPLFCFFSFRRATDPHWVVFVYPSPDIGIASTSFVPDT